VVAADSSEPIAGVRVTVNGTTLSPCTGVALFRGLSAGTYTYAIRDPRLEFRPAGGDIQLSAGGTSVNVVLDRYLRNTLRGIRPNPDERRGTDAEVYISVVDTHYDIPISDARVTIDGAVYPTQGGFTAVRGLAPGTHTLSIDAPGHSGIVREIDLSPGDCLLRHFALREPSDFSPLAEAELVLSNLLFPTAIAVADSRLWFTEKDTGNLRLVQDGILQREAYAHFDIAVGPEWGLVGLTLSPDFPAEPYLYVYFTYKADDGMYFAKLVRLTDVGSKGVDPVTLFDRVPTSDRGPEHGFHVGGVLKFGPDGKLYVLAGDAGSCREEPPPIPLEACLAQQLDNPAGKVLRLNRDGSIPEDNPFPGSPIYTYGHRNMFGLAFHPVTADAWITENGPQSNDEINRLLPGGNYGWLLPPDAAVETREPVFATGSIVTAPTNLVIPKNSRIPGLDNNLVFGEFNFKRLRMLVLSPPDFQSVEASVTVLYDTDGPITAVTQDPIGDIWYSTVNTIKRLVPRPTPDTTP